MGKKWRILIGTKTTPRKQSAIRRARAGLLDVRSLEYVQLKYRAALYWPLKNILLWMSDPQIRDFAQDCVNDAFTRIKEYNAQYRFRTFLVNKIIFPTLEELFRKRGQEKVAVREHHIAMRAYRKYKVLLRKDLRYRLAQEFIKDALLQLKRDNEVKYEVFCRRHYENLPYKEIYNELKTIYTLTITSEDATRKTYQRAEKKLKHLYRELIRQGRYIDNDLPFSKGVFERLRAETTKK